MYAGKIVESGTTEDLLIRPAHPYTVGLLRSVPKLAEEQPEPLVPIIGAPPDLGELSKTCAFCPRCPYALDTCRTDPAPELAAFGGGQHFRACRLQGFPEVKTT